MSDVSLLARLIAEHIRPPATWTSDTGAGTASYTFDPPLSPAEQATLDDLVTMARFGVTLTLAEWQSVKPDAQLLKAYLGVASPTLAQTAAAAKAIVRVLATIIRS